MVEEKLVLIIGDRPHNINTLSIFLKKGIKVAGVVIASTSTKGYKYSKVLRMLRTEGLLSFVSVFCQLALDKVLFGSMNRRWYSARYASVNLNSLKKDFKFDLLFCENYSSEGVYEFISKKNPSVIVVHTQIWVPKKIREISSVELILGGHPGNTNYHRGTHSPFWAIRSNEPDKIGCTVFELDAGVDTGKILSIRHMPWPASDTYQIISWKLMAEIAEMQVNVLKHFYDGEDFPTSTSRKKGQSVLYGAPKFFDYMIYLVFYARKSLGYRHER